MCWAELHIRTVSADLLTNRKEENNGSKEAHPGYRRLPCACAHVGRPCRLDTSDWRERWPTGHRRECRWLADHTRRSYWVARHLYDGALLHYDSRRHRRANAQSEPFGDYKSEHHQTGRFSYHAKYGFDRHRIYRPRHASRHRREQPDWRLYRSDRPG